LAAMSKVMRSIKNVTKGYSSAQIKVRNGVFRFPCSNEDGHLLICTATSNDPWGPTGTEMSEIAQMISNSTEEYYEVMDMLDKRLNDKGKNWRHPLKALKVLDYALHEGSELVVTWARKNIYIIKALREFQYLDEDGIDVGQHGMIS
jgi:epsin